MDQSLVGYLDKFCGTFTPAHLAGRTKCRSNVSWLDWCPNPSTGSLQRRWPAQAPYPPLLGVFARVILVDSWGVSIMLGFYLAQEMHPHLVISSRTLSPSPAACSLRVPIPPASSPSSKLNLFPFPLPLLIPPCYLAFLDLWTIA